MKTEAQIRQQYERIGPGMDERMRREWAASEAMALGHGGIAVVHRATGIVPSTIGKGVRELRERDASQPATDQRRVRRPGAGRKRKLVEEPELAANLERLVEPTTRGDPESPLRWTCKSLRNLAEELLALGHDISYRTVGRILKSLGYSLQANSKTFEGAADHPDRNEQFEYIGAQVAEQLASGNPALSVDTKKKELIGNYKNAGREFRPTGCSREVKVYDFVGELGRASPYGVYDIGDDAGWVSVGISADTSEFAVATVRRWCDRRGAERYPDLSHLLLTADGGGSNGSRVRLWKLELQNLADELDVPITVCHLPPGTSKWNKIEHRLFSFITMNWRGQPLTDYQTIVSLIGATKTRTGLEVHCELDDAQYEKGRTVTDAEMAGINLQRHSFHGEWNYTIWPRSTAGTKA